MTELILHKTTRRQLEALISHQPHAVLISGAQGSGKKTVALYAASKILEHGDLSNHPYFLQILPINQTIGIENIRQAKTFLAKKTIGVTTIRRMVVIGDAHYMTTEAQNALLKILEEPPEDTMLILTTSDLHALKPTILSRVQHIAILPLSKEVAVTALKSHGMSEQTITGAYYMSGGRIGLLLALLEQKADHEVVNAIKIAKEFLRMNSYERLAKTDGLSKDKEALGLFVEGLQRVIASGLEQAALKNNEAQVKKFHEISMQLSIIQQALAQNANAKLALTNLFLQM